MLTSGQRYVYSLSKELVVLQNYGDHSSKIIRSTHHLCLTSKPRSPVLLLERLEFLQENHRIGLFLSGCDHVLPLLHVYDNRLFSASNVIDERVMLAAVFGVGQHVIQTVQE